MRTILVLLVLFCAVVPICIAYEFTSPNGFAVNDSYYSKEYVEKFYQRRLLMEKQNAEQPHHHLNWRSLEEVNGLKNSEVIVFIISSNGNGEKLLWERVMPVARTWFKMFKNTYAIVEDNFMMRFALRHCLHREYSDYSTFECHGEPTYLLTRKCSNEYYVWRGPCCKVDEMINFIGNESPELFKTIKYLLLADDDTFFRADAAMNWLAAVEKSGVGHFPIVANPAPTIENPAHGVWHIKGCTEITASGWMQPLMFTHAAIEKMRIGSAAHGLMDTCRNFDLSQDVGIEVYVWLFGLYHIWLPRVEINGGHKGSEIFQPDLMAVHGLKHDQDHCGAGQENDWPEKDRYDQRLVIGCGDIDHHGPFHDSKKMADMYDAWEYFRDHGQPMEFGIAGQHEFILANVTLLPHEGGHDRVKEILPKDAKIEADGTYKGDKVVEKVVPKMYLIGGYSGTKHGKENDIVGGKWKEFAMSDCSPPGRIDK